MTVIITSNQSILDIALQTTGSVQNAFLIAQENSMAITDSLVAGNQLIIPSGIAVNKEILDFYTAKNVMPATDEIFTDLIVPEPEGIGYWIINKNFKVS